MLPPLPAATANPAPDNHSPLKIGEHSIQGRFFLAPMAGITDAVFRGLCAHFGAALTFSEMITADTRLWQSAKTRSRLLWSEQEPIKAIQLAGADADQLLSAARQAVAAGANWIDINMGCPMKKVCKRWAGSALMANPLQVAKILETLTQHLTVPVSLKTRLGLDTHQQNVLEIAKIAENSGVAMLTIHGRTRAQRFSGQACYEKIAEVKARIGIPVIANGDINTPQQAKAVLAKTGADGLMIGRAAFGQPWIFQILNQGIALNHNHLNNNTPGTHAANTNHATNINFCARQVMQQHISGLHAHYDEYRGVRVARKHLKWYAEKNHLPNSALSALLSAETAAEQLSILKAYQ